jgi:hypothetical protein
MAKSANVVPAVSAPVVVTIEGVRYAQIDGKLLPIVAVPASDKAQAAAKSEEKPKAKFDGHGLFATLSKMSAGVEIGATKTKRPKVTAFCADGTIVTVLGSK